MDVSKHTVLMKNKHPVVFFYFFYQMSWMDSNICASNIMHFPLDVPYKRAPEYINNIRCADKCSYIYSKWVRPVEWFLNRQSSAPQRAEETVWMEITAQETNISSGSIRESRKPAAHELNTPGNAGDICHYVCESQTSPMGFREL